MIKIRKAYEIAQKNRDYEIDKFWSRSSYFWVFIAGAFTAYYNAMTSEKHISLLLQIAIICAGLIFSVAWLYVIKGGKKWQENWENHLEKLEPYITGRLYKTIFVDKKKLYYSVSKINELTAWVIIAAWITIAIDFVIRCYSCAELWEFPFWLIVVVATFFMCCCIQCAHSNLDGKNKLQNKMND